MFKRALSYFIPINVLKKNSKFSKSLEVTWNNGQLVLDSLNTNYSFGSLQRILRIGLLEIGSEKIRGMQHILVLGVAAGSVIRTLTDELKYANKITGVEIDPDVISIANEYFALDKIPNLTVQMDDAFEFVLKTKEKYDLIIVDIFNDAVMPNFLFESFFVNRIGELINAGGHILFNTMILSAEDEIRNRRYLAEIDSDRLTVRAIPRLENHNELILLTKKS